MSLDSDWRAWYTGGRVYSSTETAWNDLPSAGCLGVVVYLEPPYREVIAGGDWYYIDNGELAASDTTWGEWVEPPDVPLEQLKRGAAVPDEGWESVREEMQEAREWP